MARAFLQKIRLYIADGGTIARQVRSAKFEIATPRGDLKRQLMPYWTKIGAKGYRRLTTCEQMETGTQLSPYSS